MDIEPKRVLHVFGKMDRGGAETFIMNVYRNIDRKRLQFDFAVHTNDPGHYDQEISSLGGRIFILPKPDLRHMGIYCNEFKNILQSFGPFNAIHSHVQSFSGIVVSVAKWEKIKIRIAHSHNVYDGKPNSIPRRIYRYLMREIIGKNANYLFGCSSCACEALFGRKNIKNKRAVVIKNGIDLRQYDLFESKEEVRAKINLPADRIIIGNVARFSEQKNHLFLIDVFKEFLEKNKRALLVLVGDGPLKKKVEEYVLANGLGNNVIFFGVREDIPQILTSLDLVIFPSKWEGLPLALVEAQAAGVPCVVSDSITGDVDMQLGLIYRLSLNDPLEKWGEKIRMVINQNRPTYKERIDKIRQSGYDILECSKFLENIYLS